MPCACKKPQENYPENKEWGPLLWTVLHGLAEYAGKSPEFFKYEEVTAWLTILKQLQFIIPCTDCRQHYTAYYKANPLTKDNIIQNIRIWLFNLHNDVNKRKEVDIFLLENLSESYPPCIIKPHIIALKIKMELVIQLNGVRLNDWVQWYTKVMHLKSYYSI